MKYPNEMTDNELQEEHDSIYQYFLSRLSVKDCDKLGILLGLDRELNLRDGE